MDAAHILPFSLNSFDSDDDNGDHRLKDAAHTCKGMLQSWTQLDIKTLSGTQTNLNSPSNAIYMTVTEHRYFRNFQFYLDKDATSIIDYDCKYPHDANKYRAKFNRDGRYFSNSVSEADVQFPPFVESDVLPPDPEFIRIHAAFAKVLHLTVAAECIYDYDDGGEGEGGFAELLISKLQIVAR
ncbi:hypothetical protein HGRIS_001458 [Hohenbuehelia grisea]|uniref:HNH nuclease domain-containing protein n=1 Tax=Hohenbuehelia grisea TaxID=104357 RepID=A0ABR3IZC0_9AGAR